MMEWIDGLALLIGLVFAPMFYVSAAIYRQRYQQVLMTWRKPSMAFFTILAFMANLVFFVLTTFFFTLYLGGLDGVLILSLSKSTILHLGLASLLLLMGNTVCYFALQHFFTQFVTTEGIYLNSFPALLRNHRQGLLFWEEIKDYYVQSDYPVSNYRFIVEQPDGSYTRKRLKVPFYIAPRFEVMLDMHLRRSQEHRELRRGQLRKMSRN